MHMSDQEPKGDPLVRLAKEAIAAYVCHGKTIAPPRPLPPEMAARAGAFVSIKEDGELRGCIGTYEPQQANLAEEIIHNAISAATADPRFPPIEPWELERLDVSVDVLSPPEPVDGVHQLDARRYGVIVRSGYRTGLLLPDLEGVDTPEQQVMICMRKAGIGPGEPISLFRFTVERHHAGSGGRR
jgi:hypothetical protein